MIRTDISPQALRSARKAAGLTQQCAALALGVSGKQVIWNWENGFSKPSAGMFMLLATLYKVDPDTLLTKSTKDLCFTP